MFVLKRMRALGMVIFTGQNLRDQLGCSSLDGNIWDGEKEIKTIATKLAKLGQLTQRLQGMKHRSN